MKEEQFCTINAVTKTSEMEINEKIPLEPEARKAAITRLMARLGAVAVLFDAHDAVDALGQLVSILTEPPGNSVTIRTIKVGEVVAQITTHPATVQCPKSTTEVAYANEGGMIDFESLRERFDFTVEISCGTKVLDTCRTRNKNVSELLIWWMDVLAKHVPTTVREENTSALYIDTIDTLMALESGEETGGDYYVSVDDYAFNINITRREAEPAKNTIPTPQGNKHLH